MANKVFANGREISCKAAAGKTICAFPDVCFTPPQTPATPPGVPIPYPNTGMSSDTTNGSKNVKVSKKEVGLKNKSNFKTSSGDEAGSAPKKGVVTSKTKGKVYFSAWSMDVKVEGKNIIRHLDLTTNNHASSMPGDTPPWPYIDTMAVAALPAKPKPKKCNPTKLELSVQKANLTLKHDRECDIEVMYEPSDLAVDAVRIETKRASGGSWCTLANSSTMKPWYAKIAGKCKIRGVVTACGKEHFTPEKDIEVKFPTYSQITGDMVVKSACDAQWRQTLTDCTQNPNRRRERGFWVLLNTTSNQYEFTATVTGSWSGPTQGASVPLPTRPADQPASPKSCDNGAIYAVASFHTHTPTEFRASSYPPGTGRTTGPSGADNTIDARDQVPGIVYDYSVGTAPMGHPKGSSAQLYKSLGVDPRPTP